MTRGHCSAISISSQFVGFTVLPEENALRKAVNKNIFRTFLNRFKHKAYKSDWMQNRVMIKFFGTTLHSSFGPEHC